MAKKKAKITDPSTGRQLHGSVANLINWLYKNKQFVRSEMGDTFHDSLLQQLTLLDEKVYASRVKRLSKAELEMAAWDLLNRNNVKYPQFQVQLAEYIHKHFITENFLSPEEALHLRYFVDHIDKEETTRKFRATRKNVTFIFGPPGVGKDVFAKELAERKHMQIRAFKEMILEDYTHARVPSYIQFYIEGLRAFARHCESALDIFLRNNNPKYYTEHTIFTHRMYKDTPCIDLCKKFGIPPSEMIDMGKSPREQLIHISERMVKREKGKGFFGLALAKDIIAREESTDIVIPGAGFYEEVREFLMFMGMANIEFLDLRYHDADVPEKIKDSRAMSSMVTLRDFHNFLERGKHNPSIVKNQFKSFNFNYHYRNVTRVPNDIEATYRRYVRTKKQSVEDLWGDSTEQTLSPEKRKVK